MSGVSTQAVAETTEQAFQRVVESVGQQAAHDIYQLVKLMMYDYAVECAEMARG